MKSNFATSFLTSALRKFNKLTAGLKETPKVEPDEFALEHFLLYHRLTGSPEVQARDIKDLKSDIERSVQTGNAILLVTSLKLPPLWWQDKLEAIFDAMSAQDQIRAAELLAPVETPETQTNTNPVMHEDWRVRANAANMLAFLKADSCAPQLVSALADCAENKSQAFCHVSYALARLKTAGAKQALIPYLSADESWFRVDAARGLSLWDLDEVGNELAAAILTHHNLSDYTCVTVAQRLSPAEFLNQTNESLQKAGQEMVIQILEAAKQTFSDEIVIDRKVHECWPILYKSLSENASPHLVRAVKGLGLWLQANASDPEILEACHLQENELEAQIADAEKRATNASISKNLVTIISKADCRTPLEESELRHALWLAGEAGTLEAAPHLKALCRSDFPLVTNVVDCAGKLGDASLAPPVVALALQCADPEKRADIPASAQPVFEDNQTDAGTYWTCLKALGNLPHASGIELLIKAANDFAPDKRSQALSSLVQAYLAYPGNASYKAQVEAASQNKLADPSAAVRNEALIAVAKLGLKSAIPDVIQLSGAKEVSIKRHAYETLGALVLSGHAQDVVEAVNRRIKSEHDQFKKKELQDFLIGLAGTTILS